jgi:DDE superfamily endonuclease
VRYWLTPAVDERRAEKIADVCAIYQAAAERAAQGERTVSTDGLTGVQALERAAPTRRLRPGWLERQEFEYIRHGTLACMINFDVASGPVVSPSYGPTRTEADFAAHVRQTGAADPTIRKWHFVVDNLDTHQSAALVRYVAEVEGIDPASLGRKEQAGILRSMATRSAFLADPSQRIVFHDTPQHASWLNQVEIWLGILVRKVIRRAHFTSVDDLQAKVLAFIAYFNRTMAHPFTWTYQGRPLPA